MLKHKSKRAGSRAAALAIVMASVGCTVMESSAPATMSPCATGDSSTSHAASPVVVDEMANPTSVEERHFDIYKRFRTLAGAAAPTQVSGGGDGRGRGNAGVTAAHGDSAKNCSIRDLNTSDWNRSEAQVVE
jgi:hypothetical protein